LSGAATARSERIRISSGVHRQWVLSSLQVVEGILGLVRLACLADSNPRPAARRSSWSAALPAWSQVVGRIGLAGSDRCSPWFKLLSGTQRARPRPADEETGPVMVEIV
jgi:hypothetical protein